MANKKPLRISDDPNDLNPEEFGATDTLGIDDGGTGATSANDGLNNLLPSQTGNTDKYLQTDGSSTSWQEVPEGIASCETFTQAAHGLSVGDVVRSSSGSWVKAQADTGINSEAIALVAEVIDANNLRVCYSGRINGLSGLTPDCVYFLDESTAGALTLTEPVISKPILFATSATSAVLLIMRGIDSINGISGGGSAPVFGSEYNYSESEADTGTASTSFQPKLSLVTPSLPAGDYRVGYSWEGTVSANGIVGEYKVEVVGGDLIACPTMEADNDWLQFGGFRKTTLSGVNTITLSYLSGDGISTTRARRARLEIWRVE